MEGRFVQQMKKGVLDMIVLRYVAEKDTYGYELLQKLEREGDGFFDLKEGTLYPVLYRLEDSGLIGSFWGTETGRSAPKKYYRITEQGRKTYEEYWNVWREFSACVNQICGGKTPEK